MEDPQITVVMFAFNKTGYDVLSRSSYKTQSNAVLLTLCQPGVDIGV